MRQLNEQLIDLSVSVIIPHLNQPDELRRCLESLSRTNSPDCLVEIIVVDNGSKRSPKDVCDHFPSVRLLEEDYPGPGPARNTGAAVAKGDILAFIDADCIADENWLAEMVRLFRCQPETCILGGTVQVPRPESRPLTDVEAYERIYAYRIASYISRRGFAGTGNLAVRRQVFGVVGPFAGVEVSEDRDWGMRAGRCGYKIHFAARMIVNHPARNSFAELKLKWDRHIVHDYMDVRGQTLWRTRILLRALALAVSPLVEISTVATTRQLEGGAERWGAFACLLRIRFYRAIRMAKILAAGPAAANIIFWNRN